MANTFGDLSTQSIGNFTLFPAFITANTTGIAVPTTNVDGGIFTGRFSVGAVNTFTSAICTFESSPDGNTWTAMNASHGGTANVTITAANTTGVTAFFPANGTLSPYVRGNVILSGTSANITAVIEGALRIGTNAGYVATPPSGST